MARATKVAAVEQQSSGPLGKKPSRSERRQAKKNKDNARREAPSLPSPPPPPEQNLVRKAFVPTSHKKSKPGSRKSLSALEIEPAASRSILDTNLYLDGLTVG